MPHVSYIANGFSKTAKKPLDMAGMCELRFWNPTPVATKVRMKVYYSDKPPIDLPEYAIEAESDPLLVFPQCYPKEFNDCGPWGMRLVSDTMLMADNILCACYEGPPDKMMYRGGVGDTLVKTRLSRVWYFSDGIRILQDVKNPNPAFPFHEFEWYHILNPNPAAANVTMQLVLGPGQYEEQRRTVGAERVLMFDNFDAPSRPFGIRFISDQPIIVESERVIYGLQGIQEWGAYIHCQRPGLPAPLEWNEDGVL